MSYAEKVKELEQGACVQTPMPRYQCHKKVWALKIASIEIIQPTIEEIEAILNGPEGAGENMAGAIITPADQGFAPFGVPKSYVDKHNPEAGGYYVVYDDGYKSFSPAKAFEDGYTRL